MELSNNFGNKEWGNATGMNQIISQVPRVLVMLEVSPVGIFQEFFLFGYVSGFISYLSKKSDTTAKSLSSKPIPTMYLSQKQ